MKKNKFLVFYTIFASLVLAAALGFLGFNLFTEYNHGYERCKKRSEHLSKSFKSISTSDFSSNYKLALDKAIGDLNDFSYLEIQENGKIIYLYPNVEAKANTNSDLIKSFYDSFELYGNDYFITSNLYLIRPVSIYYYLKITFFIVLILTLITIALIIYFNAKENKTDIVKYSDEQSEISQDNTFETVNTENTVTEPAKEEIEDDDEEIETEVIEEEQQQAKYVLPTEDFKPSKLETLNEDKSADPSGLYSPVTGLGWESYFIPRLENELNRAIASELDLSLFIIKIPGLSRENEKVQKICDYLISQFQFKDLLFEYKEDSIAALKVSMNLDEALTFADKLYVDIKNILISDKCYIGISTRTIRMISADRLLLEADEALAHAQEDPEDPIIAFRANAEKYRQFLENN